ncbi:MAG: type I restriction enzyme HsdR N-terminal domain-containing protein [Bacteroidales bacterium]|nr:type I restriction enzyme HsdR N-terminal domain-containing protein [Bacteroidales bacterium]
MEFKERLTELAHKIVNSKRLCLNEEGTKTALVLPLLQLLGYDIHNPSEIVPEVNRDIKGRGDRVDYIVRRDDADKIVIECKHWDKALTGFVPQLASYYVASDARFGILTNGIDYWLYTDTCKKNLMDDTPFVRINIEYLDEIGMEWLQMFSKDRFNDDKIWNKAYEQKTIESLRKTLRNEYANPSADLTLLMAKRIFGNGHSKTDNQRLKPLLQQAIKDVAHEIETGEPLNEPVGNVGEQSVLAIVQDVLSDMVSKDRIQLFVGSSYSTIRLDGIVWYSILKFKWTGNVQWVSVSKMTYANCKVANSLSNKHYLNNLDEIRTYSKDIRDIVKVLTLPEGTSRQEWITDNRPDWK